MTILDDIKKIKKIDQSNMVSLITEMPQNFEKTWEKTQKIKLTKKYQDIENIVFCGMGASGISGELIQNITSKQLKKPLLTVHDWRLPLLVGPKSLVFLTSYSGETQETLSCAKQALIKKAKLFIITQGGKLKKFSQEKKIPCFSFNYQACPRASLPFLLMPALSILNNLGVINVKKFAIKESLKELQKFNQNFYPETKTEKNIAKYLAYFIFNHVPIIITPTILSGVARRWKTQLAENSKNFSFFETIPEIFHNFVESEKPWHLKNEFIFLFLENEKEKTFPKKNIEKLKKFLDKKGINWEQIPCFGKNIFTQVLSLVLLGDWISLYLAILNETDPTPVNTIKKLKTSKNAK